MCLDYPLSLILHTNTKMGHMSTKWQDVLHKLGCGPSPESMKGHADLRLSDSRINLSIVCGLRIPRQSGKILLSWFCMCKTELRVDLGQVVSTWTNCTLTFDVKQVSDKGFFHDKAAHFIMDKLYKWKSFTRRCTVCLNCYQVILLCRTPQHRLVTKQ